MAQAGVGVGMLEISRMERAMRRPTFTKRVFTKDERAFCDRTAHPAQHYAARYAARVAVIKALGVRPEDGIGRRDVSVALDDGRPRALLSGTAAWVASKKGVREVALSLSFTHDVAVANAVAMTDAVRPKVEERSDPKEELRASFREARSVLDELDRAGKEGRGATVTPGAREGE